MAELKGDAAKRFVKQEHLLTELRTYTLEALKMSHAFKNTAIAENNPIQFNYAQGSLDLLYDLNNIFARAHIPTLEEIEKRKKDHIDEEGRNTVYG